MVRIENLHKSFKRKEVLRGIDLQLDNGIYGLLGPNGAGKTTLIRCITNLYDYKRGEIHIDNSNIGYLPQNFGVYKELTVKENMKFLCVLKEINAKNEEEQINWALEKVNLLEHSDNKAKSLSGGMLRRLGIAQALLGKPKVLIFDEPTAGLDPEERLRFKRVVAEVSKERVVIISTHIVEDVEALCNKIIVMNKGKVSTIGSSKEIADIAKGKVYQWQAENVEALKEEHFIEKEYEQKGEVFYRILCNKSLDSEPLPATIEDGYLCILKNI